MNNKIKLAVMVMVAALIAFLQSRAEADYSIFGNDNSYEEKSGFSAWISSTGESISNWFSVKNSEAESWWKETSPEVEGWLQAKGSEAQSWWAETSPEIEAWFISKGSDAKEWARQAGTDIKDWAIDNGPMIRDFAIDFGTELLLDFLYENYGTECGEIHDTLTSSGLDLILEAVLSN